MSSSRAGASTSTTKSRFYYELVTLKASIHRKSVEDTLHRVPKYHLETRSTMFKDMFSLPQGSDTEGASDENAIVLSGCTNSEFESLVDILLTPGGLAPLKLTKDQWISVLKLSTVWEIPDARGLSVSKLHSLNIHPSEMVTLGRKYKVMSLFVDGCATLARANYAPGQLEMLAAIPPSIVGFPRDIVRCLQCSALLNVMETPEVACGSILPTHGIGPHAHPPPVSVQPQAQPPPPSHPQTPGPGPTQAQLQAQQSPMYQQMRVAAQIMSAKRSLLVKYMCPTPGCRGVASTSGVRLDLSAVSGIGSPLPPVDLSTAIEKVFADETKDMY